VEGGGDVAGVDAGEDWGTDEDSGAGEACGAGGWSGCPLLDLISSTSRDST
jgi:hypothetical protein